MTDIDEAYEPARPTVAAGALFSDERGRVLLVQTSYEPHRDIPGGFVEDGESPRQACAREVREELGVIAALGRLLAVDWAPAEGGTDRLLFVFDAGVVTDNLRERIQPDGDEIVGWDFHPVAELDDLLIPRLARRVAAAAAARRVENTVYLEHGSPPGAVS